MITQNPALLDAAMNRLFLDAMNESASMSYLADVASVVTTDRRTFESAHMGASPAMTLIRPGDSYVFRPMSEATVSRTVEKYGAGVEISEDDWDDDLLGGFPQRVQELGDDAVLLVNALLMAACVNGDAATSLGYDDVPFFSAAHPARGQAPAWSNIVTGAGTTAAQTITNLNRIVQAFGAIRRENGRAANPAVRAITLCAPYALRQPIIEALQSDTAGIVNNVSIRDIAWTVIFDADLDADDTSDFYAFNSFARLRGLVWISRAQARLIAEQQQVGEGFDRDVRRWKSKLRGAVMYGRPQSALKINN